MDGGDFFNIHAWRSNIKKGEKSNKQQYDSL